MKRYALFAGHKYYPDGGWADFQSDHDTLNEAIAAGEAWVSLESGGDDESKSYLWWHTVDTHVHAKRVGDDASCDDKRGLTLP